MGSFLGILSGVFTALLIVLFALLYAWAWSGARRRSFDASARLPLEEDAGTDAPLTGERNS